ncbi:hypothetical protein WUBG_13540 [Wuchereria bancrofti]|uniref:CUE domain-containing protein n=1 Tax=Wuchereria bancrofti TaxID=6293 RepID=J9E051_WUCBA|nr:hypothetical protein WUBG_13540 [Wuchereria bancrofti]
MFPQLEVASVLEDLRESGSVQATVENILDGRFRQQDIALDSDEEIYNAVDTSSSNSSTESSGEHEETLTPSSSSFNSCSAEYRDIFLTKKRCTYSAPSKVIFFSFYWKYIASSRGKDLRDMYDKDIQNTGNSDSLRQRGGRT